MSVWSFAEDVDALEVVFGLLTAPTENDLKLAASILLYPLKGGKKKTNMSDLTDMSMSVDNKAPTNS